MRIVGTETYPYKYPFKYSGQALTALIAEQKKMSVSPVLKFDFFHGSSFYRYETDRILRIEHTEEHDSHKAEIVLQDADKVLQALDLKGYQVKPQWGLKTSGGDDTSQTAPLWVRDQRGDSARGRLICTLSCIGMPDRLAEEKADDDYALHWSSTKTVLDLATEIADGSAVTEELTEKQDTSDGYINLDQTGTDPLDAVGQRISIPDRLVTKISFRLKKTGLPAGTNVTFVIRDVDTDAILASQTFAIASIGSDPAWCEATLATPVQIDKEITWSGSTPSGGVWIYCLYQSGDAANYVSVSYNSFGVKTNEWMTYIYSVAGVSEISDQDCAYRYKYTDAGIPVFQHCHDATPSTGWEVVDDTAGADSLLDSYCPADAFFIRSGESRLNVIDKLLAYTGTERMFKADGKIHLVVPVKTGTTYDYEYALSSGHTFFNKSIREALVIPNKIVVESFPDDDTIYTGSYTSATSYALMPVQGAPVRTKLTSNAQAIAIATAMISHLEVASQRGSATVPMNALAEEWDYVKVTDERSGDSRTGNVGYLSRLYIEGKSTYQMTFGFGGVPVKGVPGTQLSRLKSLITEASMEADLVVKWGAILPTLELTALSIDKIQQALNDILVGLGYYDGQPDTEGLINDSLVGYLKNLVEDLTPQLGGTLDTQGHTISNIVALRAATVMWLQSGTTTKIGISATENDSFNPLDMNSNKITALAAPADAADAARKTDVDTVDAKLNDISTTDQTANRALDTTYQNSTKLRLVTVIVSTTVVGGSDIIFALMDSTTPPTSTRALKNCPPDAAFATTYNTIYLLVPPSWYYKFASNSTTATLYKWTEQDLF